MKEVNIFQVFADNTAEVNWKYILLDRNIGPCQASV